MGPPTRINATFAHRSRAEPTSSEQDPAPAPMTASSAQRARTSTAEATSFERAPAPEPIMRSSAAPTADLAPTVRCTHVRLWTGYVCPRLWRPNDTYVSDIIHLNTICALCVLYRCGPVRACAWALLL